MSAYEIRRTERADGLRGAAERKQREADAAHTAAKDRADRIPLGQPILVGHHSEARHRRDAERIDRGMRKSVDLAAEAEELARRADAAERNTAISSDDPEAIEKLGEKIAALETRHARMVAINKVIRRSKHVREEDLIAMGLSPEMIEKLLTPDDLGDIGFADYQIKNSSAEIRRLKHRRKELVARANATPPAPVPFPGGVIVEEDNRVRIRFDAKPGEATCKALRGAGFVWSSMNGAWQRKPSVAAWYWAKRVVGLEGGE